MTVAIQAIRCALSQFRQALEQSSGQGCEALFHGRDQLRLTTDALEASPSAHLVPLVESMQLILKGLLRSGDLDMKASVEVLASLADNLETLTCTSSAMAANPLAASYLGVTGLAGSGAISRGDGHLHAGEGGSVCLPGFLDGPDELQGELHSNAGSQQEASGCSLDKSEVTRLLADGAQVTESRLGQVLLREHVISTDQLDRALTIQQITRRKLGEVLVAMELVGLETLNNALEKQRQVALNLVGDHAPAGQVHRTEGSHLRLAEPER